MRSGPEKVATELVVVTVSDFALAESWAAAGRVSHRPFDRCGEGQSGNER